MIGWLLLIVTGVIGSWLNPASAPWFVAAGAVVLVSRALWSSEKELQRLERRVKTLEEEGRRWSGVIATRYPALHKDWMNAWLEEQATEQDQRGDVFVPPASWALQERARRAALRAWMREAEWARAHGSTIPPPPDSTGDQ